MNKPAAKPPPEDHPRIIDKRWGLSLPLVIMVATIVVANLKLFYDVQSKTTLLGKDVASVAEKVDDLNETMKKFTAETSTELRSLRSQITNLKVEVAVLRTECKK